MARDKFGKEIPDQAFEDSDFGTRTSAEIVRMSGLESHRRMDALIQSRKPKNSIDSIMSKIDNAKLRLGEGVADPEVEKIDKVLNAATLTEEVTGSRFVTPDAEQWLLAREGQTFTEPGFTSISLNPEEVRKVVGDEVREIPIVLPKGTHALVMGSAVLVKRNQKFEIRQDKKWLRLTLVAL